MRKITLAICCILAAVNIVSAGGIVTNTNQSAAWARILARDASVGIDAVYFNPAGLTFLNDGLHFSISNQTLGQTRTITSSFPYLNNNEYIGEVSAPVFPTVYAAYKMGKLAVSFGFNPIGGGGGGTFADGLPSLETPVSTLAPMFQGLGLTGVTGYSTNMNFESSSIYWGAQLGASYEINEFVSVYAGLRYVMAKDTYLGSLTDIMLVTDKGNMAPGDYLTSVASDATAGATLASGAASGMQPLIDGGAGAYTFAQAQAGGVLDAATVAQLQGGLLAMGVDQAVIDQMSIAQAQATYQTIAGTLTGTAAVLNGTAPVVAAQTADQNADVVQTGTGITPILGLNLSLLDKALNVGMKYEFQTNMNFTNETKDDFITAFDQTGQPIATMFPDGAETNKDMPAMFSIGADYRVIDPLKVSVGMHTYFDGNTGWAEVNGVSKIDKNFLEIAFGLEYNLTDDFLVSAGYLMTTTGANANYQSDLSYSVNTGTIGFGGAYQINDMLQLNAGAYFVNYDVGTFDKSYDLGEITVPYEESYTKKLWAVAIGIDISLGK